MYYSTHSALVFDAVAEVVAGRELPPQDECGAVEQHLTRGQCDAIGVVEGQRAVDHVLSLHSCKLVDTHGVLKEAAEKHLNK